MVLCSAPRVAALVRSGVAMWRPDALLGRPCDVVWCCVAGGVAAVVPRAGVAASVVCDGVVALVVASCGAASLGARVTALAYGGRRELGSGAPATLSGLRRGSCVAGGGTLSRGPWAVGRGPWVVRRVGATSLDASRRRVGRGAASSSSSRGSCRRRARRGGACRPW